MKRSEATALYVVLMLALLAGPALRWAANSPRMQALMAARRNAMVLPAAPAAPAMAATAEWPPIVELPMTEASQAAVQAMYSGAVCRRLQARLAAARARMAARANCLRSQQARLEVRDSILRARHAQRRWIMVTPTAIPSVVSVPQVRIEVSNP